MLTTTLRCLKFQGESPRGLLLPRTPLEKKVKMFVNVAQMLLLLLEINEGVPRPSPVKIGTLQVVFLSSGLLVPSTRPVLCLGDQAKQKRCDNPSRQKDLVKILRSGTRYVAGFSSVYLTKFSLSTPDALNTVVIPIISLLAEQNIFIS